MKYSKSIKNWVTFIAVLGSLQAAQANVLKWTDTFYNTHVLEYTTPTNSSITYDDHMAAGGYTYSQTPVSDFTLQKVLYANGREDHFMYLYKKNGFSVNSTIDFKYNSSIIPIPRTKFTSFDMLNISAYFITGAIESAKPTDSLQYRFGAYTVTPDESTIKIWKQVLAGDPRDATTPTIRARSSNNLQVAGKHLMGWVADPYNDAHKSVVHVYRGQKLLFTVVADTEDCRAATKHPCQAVGKETLVNWQKFIYAVDLEKITGASGDRIFLYAISSKAGTPNTELFSGDFVLKDDIDCVYGWAEKVLPDLLPRGPKTVVEGNNRVRRYSNGSVLATAFALGDFSYKTNGGDFIPSGKLQSFIPAAIAADCGR